YHVVGEVHHALHGGDQKPARPQDHQAESARRHDERLPPLQVNECHDRDGNEDKHCDKENANDDQGPTSWLANRIGYAYAPTFAGVAWPFSDGSGGHSFQLFACRQKFSGLSWTTFRMIESAWPRRFIS